MCMCLARGSMGGEVGEWMMCLLVLCVLCLTVLVNCLMNAFAICMGEIISSSPVFFFVSVDLSSFQVRLSKCLDPILS